MALLAAAAVILASAVAIGCGGETDAATGKTTAGAGGSGGGTETSTGGATATGGTGGGAPLGCDSDPPYSTVPVVECDLLAQDCPEGSACEPVGSGTSFVTECVQESGLKPVRASCANHAECQGGLYCVFGQCAPACCPATDQPCNGGTCNTTITFGNDEVFVCSFLTACDLFTPDACPAPQGCHVLKSQGISVCIDPAASTVGEGESCTYVNECGDMQSCWPPGFAGAVCRYLCDVAGGSGKDPGLGGCPAAQSCKAAATGIDGVGICGP